MHHTRNYQRACDSLFSIPYGMFYFTDFDYSRLQYINTVTRVSRKHKTNQLFNDCFIMADTETSKKVPGSIGPNHVCAWSIAIRAYHRNVCTLWGTKPDELCRCISDILKYMQGDHTIIYFHNFSYDYVFLRRFFFEEWGTPKKQLAVKPHYPISMDFKNGLQFRDSLILSQCKLEKWAEDLDVEHKKAVGKWDYEKIRNQDPKQYNDDELLYIQNDVLAGVECLDTLCERLKKHVYTMPYTATGVPRDDTRKIGRKYHAHQTFIKCSNEWQVQMMLEMLYHGGYTHCDRGIAGWIQSWAECFDFTSSYPFSMLQKVPCDKFRPYDGAISPERIIEHSDRYAFMFVLSVSNFALKDPFYPMPMLQASKLLHSELTAEDNGRVVAGAFASIIFNEYDLQLFMEQYQWPTGWIRITDVYYAPKDYLPRWLTDYIYELFKEKSEAKFAGDPVRVAIAKSKINCIYGLCVQKPVRKEITEDYETGLYTYEKDEDMENKYNEKYLKNYNNVLPYCYGVWVTSESMFRLYQLSKCIAPGGHWLYSDTDSIYATAWDQDKVDAYNENIRQFCIERGYPPIYINGEEFLLGKAELDGVYSEWVGLGAKRYCCRYADDERNKKKNRGKLKITISGVPKKGVEQLHDDINEFKVNTVFEGIISGKKQHTYFFLDKDQPAYIDENGNLTGDSIDLSPCDYTLDSPYELTDPDDVEEVYYLPEMEDFD